MLIVKHEDFDMGLVATHQGKLDIDPTASRPRGSKDVIARP